MPSKAGPPESFQFLNLPPEIRLQIYRLLLHQFTCYRYNKRLRYCLEYEDGTDEYLYNSKGRSFTKQKVALPENVIHIASREYSVPGISELALDNCCQVNRPTSSSVDKGQMALLRANKLIFTEASNVVYREFRFDFIDKVINYSDNPSLQWHHYVQFCRDYFPFHLVKRVELHIPNTRLSFFEFVVHNGDDEEDEEVAIETLLRKILREQLPNVTNLRLRARFSFTETDEMHVIIFDKFLGMAARICAEHRFLKRTAVSFQKQPTYRVKVGDLWDSWVKVELSAISEARDQMVRIHQPTDPSSKEGEYRAVLTCALAGHGTSRRQRGCTSGRDQVTFGHHYRFD